MKSFADKIVALAATIGREREIAIRKLCDDVDRRIKKLESATKNTGEGSTSQTGAVSHSQSGGGSDGTREPARSARIDDRDSMLERVDRIARLDAEVAQLDRNLQAEVVARVKAHCTCTHEKRLHANATDGCLVSGCRCETYTGEGRAEEALSGNGRDQERAQPVRAAPPGAQALDVAGEGREPSRQAAPSPDPIPAWMPSAHELRNAHANRNYAFHADASDYEPFERIRRLIASRSPSKLPTPEDVAAPIRAALEASRSPSHELVEAADALRNEMTMPSDGSFAPFVDRSLKDKIEAYDAARSRHASGAQPDSACDESGWLVEITGPKYWTGTPGCGNWTADSLAAMRFARRQDAEAACRHLAPSGAIPVEHAWVSHRPAGAQPSGAPALASAQGEVCECGHGRAMHFDEDGDHNGPCLWQVHKDAPFCKCDMWHRKPSEDEFLGVPVSEWRQIAAEINCRRGPDGSLLKRFRELLEVSDLRAALLKKRSAPSPSPALLSALLMASDAMRYVAVRGVAFHGDKETIEAYDRARAALPKGGAA